jgi:RsiW-degrading membrane proteinase PrsW (M82 family)
MHVMLTLIIIVLSTTLWLKYLDGLDFYQKDKRTAKMVYVCFGSGVISAFLVLLFTELNPFNYFRHLMGPFLFHFLIVGLSEEFSKYLMLILTVLLFRSIKEPQDGIIQGAAVGAGFGALENLLYGLAYGPVNATVRSVISIGGHMLYTALVGFFFATAVYANLEVEDNRAKLLAVLAVIPVALMHGLYNASLTWQAYNENLVGLFMVIDIVALILTVTAFRSLIEKSPYFVFPYSRHKEAIRSIRRGLKLNPGSFILNNRLALYCLAAGRYPEALKSIRYCRKRQKKRQAAWDVLEGIALLGMRRDDEGVRLLERAKDRFQKGEQFRLELILSRVIRHAGLKMRVNNILRPKVLKHNPYFNRLLIYGKKDYWKSDKRILKERMDEFGRLLKQSEGV